MGRRSRGVTLQGNMDPAVLHGTRAIRQVQFILDNGSGTGHVFNLGHGITPDVSLKMQVFINAVHSLSQGYHMEDTGKIDLEIDEE